MTDRSSINTSPSDWRKQASEQGARLQGLVILNFTRGPMESCYARLAGATNDLLEFHGLTEDDHDPDQASKAPPWLINPSKVAEKIRGKQVLFTNPTTREQWSCIDRLQQTLPELDARSLHMPMPITLELEEKRTSRNWVNEHFPALAISSHEVPMLGSVAKRTWSDGGLDVNVIRNELDLRRHLRMSKRADNEFAYEEMIRCSKQWSIHCLAHGGQIISTSRICLREPDDMERFIYRHPAMSRKMIRTFGDASRTPSGIDRFIEDFMARTRWNGFINFEFKCRDNDEERPVVIEINPRYCDGWDTPAGDFFDITGSDIIETLARYNELARQQ